MVELMHRGFALVLIFSWCSTASAQKAVPQPRPKAQASAATAQNPNVRPDPEPQRQSITPRQKSAAGDRAPVSSSGTSSPWKMLGALLLAVGGILGVAKLLKSLGVGPLGSATPLPTSVCEVLGVTPLPPRHSLYLLRLGRKIVLVGSSGEQLTVLSEITDADEVAALIQLSQRATDNADVPSFFSRLINHAGSAKPMNHPPAANESDARCDLEAKLNIFAQSST
jgi:flagellar biogenesis protein FliO